jgi:hypothetical protein
MSPPGCHLDRYGWSPTARDGASGGSRGKAALEPWTVANCHERWAVAGRIKTATCVIRQAAYAGDEPGWSAGATTRFVGSIKRPGCSGLVTVMVSGCAKTGTGSANAPTVAVRVPGAMDECRWFSELWLVSALSNPISRQWDGWPVRHQKRADSQRSLDAPRFFRSRL